MKFAQVSMIVLAALAGAFALTGVRPASGQAHAPADPDFAAQPPAGPALAKHLEEESGLNEDIRAMVGDYARTQDEGKRAAIKAKLSPLIDKQFDFQQKRRDLEVAQLEAQLKKVRELIRKRADARQTIVEPFILEREV